MKWQRLLLVGFLSLGVAAGCGDDEDVDDNQNQNQNQNDFDPDLIVADMDDDEIDALCNQSDETWSDLSGEEIEDGRCKYGALDFAQDGDDPIQQCDTAYDDCLDSLGDTEGFCEFEDWDESERDECEATAGEVLDCVEEEADAVAVFADDFVCEDIGEDGQVDEAIEAAMDDIERRGSACADLIDACPPADLTADGPGPGDDFEEEVDVWVGADIGNEDNLTPVADGETFGGRFANDGSHYFSFDAPAGEAFEISTADVEADLEDSLEELSVAVLDPQPEQPFGENMYFGIALERMFWPDVDEQRQFFAAVDGEFIIRVDAPGGEDQALGFSFELNRVDMDVDDDGLELPGTTAAAKTDGQLDAYQVSVGETTSVALEVLAQQLADPSDLHAWLYVWNVDEGGLVAESNGQSEELLDPQTTFAMEADTDYIVVVDMVDHVLDADYEVAAEFLATSEDNPQWLSLDDVSEFDGTIVEREDDYYTDYFTLSVEPGDYKRVTVEGTDELEPGMLVTEEDDMAFFTIPDWVLPVGDQAGVVLGVDESAPEAAHFDVEVTDVRNLLGDDDAPFGGDEYTYSLTLEEAQLGVHEADFGEQQEVVLQTPGDVTEMEADIDDGHLLWLDGGSDAEFDADTSPEDLEFLPAWALGGFSTLASTSELSGYYWGTGNVQSFLFRDAFFRGGADFASDVRMKQFDINPPYDTSDLVDDNEDSDSASELETPTTIEGEFTEEDVEDPETYYYSVSANTGEFIVVSTENDPEMETFLTIFDDDDEMLAESAMLMEQHQVGGEDDLFFDRALVFEADADGDFILEVEQYCQDGQQAFCDIGQAAITVKVVD